MSIYLMGLMQWVTVGDVAEKAVLTWLCDVNTENGAPQEARVAKLVGLTEYKERTVRRALDTLVEKGFITVEKRPGRPSVYGISVKRLEEQKRLADTGDPGKRCRGTPAGDTGVGGDEPRQEIPDTPVRDTGVPRQEIPDTPAGDTGVTIYGNDGNDGNDGGGTCAHACEESPSQPAQEGTMSPPPLFFGTYGDPEERVVRMAYRLMECEAPEEWRRRDHLAQFENARKVIVAFGEGQAEKALNAVIKAKTVRMPKSVLEIAAEVRIAALKTMAKSRREAAEERRRSQRSEAAMMQRRAEDDETERQHEILRADAEYRRLYAEWSASVRDMLGVKGQAGIDAKAKSKACSDRMRERMRELLGGAPSEASAGPMETGEAQAANRLAERKEAERRRRLFEEDARWRNITRQVEMARSKMETAPGAEGVAKHSELVKKLTAREAELLEEAMVTEEVA